MQIPQGFIVVVVGKTCKHLIFRGNGTIRRVFCYGNERLWLHVSVNKDSFYSVHKPVKWTFLFFEGVTASQYAL